MGGDMLNFTVDVQGTAGDMKTDPSGNSGDRIAGGTVTK